MSRPSPDPSKFFQNRSCPHFPCHQGISEESFNCLFCYCPLYMLGDACGGAFTYSAKGNKVCTTCTVPHEGAMGSDLVKQHWDQIQALATRQGEAAR